MFILKPTSGFDNSYYDVEFLFQFKEIPTNNFEFKIFNRTIGQQLNILASSTGIVENNVIKSSPITSFNGFINLFNDDKMNVQLQNFASVEIECSCQIGENEIKETFTFFNESFSADRGIVPFDIALHKKEFDLKNDIFFSFDLIADCEKIIHMKIEDIHSIVDYDFYIFTQNGKLTIKIPLEILNHELHLYKNSSKIFRLSYMKNHGVNYVNVINKKKIPLNNTEIRFMNIFQLRGQKRIGPTLTKLDNNFILSDRYFVPTWYEYSFYSKKSINYSRNFYSKLLQNEITENRLINGYNSKPITNQYWETEENRIIFSKENQEVNFYKTMNNIYENSKPNQLVADKIKKTKINSKINGGCSGCGRKNRKRNS